MFGTNVTEKYAGSKSFFAHRNQFAIFLYISIISNIFLIMKYGQKRYIIPLIIFGISLVLTISRTGMLCTAIFIFLFFVTTPKIKIRYKLLIFILFAILCGISVKTVYENHPEIVQKIETVFIRKKSIKNFTGRSDIWEIGIDLVNQNNKTMAFGVGRFVGTKALETVKNYGNITQFHSFYVDMLVTGGIMEVVYLISLYMWVIVKVIRSNIENKFKTLYISAFISYAIYSAFESLGRFSIGCADTVCLIMFISIPLLHANSIQEKKKVVLKKIEFDPNNAEENQGLEEVSNIDFVDKYSQDEEIIDENLETTDDYIKLEKGENE